VLARALVSLCLLAACHGRPPTPPTAVIDATPDGVCAGDAFSTVIDVSGARSASVLSLVPAPPDPDAPPLAYEWRIEGADHEIVAGALDEAELSLVSDGLRPLHLTLTVTDVEGGTATSLRTVGLIEAIATPCEGECAPGSTCVEGLCLDDDACVTDDDCGCLVCDVELARCVPEAR
jgi:hypothetical protein